MNELRRLCVAVVGSVRVECCAWVCKKGILTEICLFDEAGVTAMLRGILPFRSIAGIFEEILIGIGRWRYGLEIVVERLVEKMYCGGLGALKILANESGLVSESVVEEDEEKGVSVSEVGPNIARNIHSRGFGEGLETLISTLTNCAVGDTKCVAVSVVSRHRGGAAWLSDGFRGLCDDASSCSCNCLPGLGACAYGGFPRDLLPSQMPLSFDDVLRDHSSSPRRLPVPVA